MVTERQRNPWLILLVLCFGFFMILLDSTIVNIAIPSIIDGLKASLDQILWVLNAYILVYAVLLITAGRLGDFFGQRNLFAAGLVIFTAASAACGLAQDPSQLIAFRVVQGVGGALIWPQTLAIITTIFPREQRGAAFGVWGAVAGLAATAGPTVGGWLTTDFTWRAIFYLNVPIGIAVLIATFLIVPDLRQSQRHRLDLVGVLLSSVGLFGIVYGLIEGQPKNWGAVLGPITIWETIAAGVVVLGAFLVWESRQQDPLLPLSLFTQNRNFGLMNIVAAAMSFGLLGLLLPFIIYLQSVQGMTALQAGLTIAPWSVVSMIVAPIAGRLADRIGGKFILMGGLFLFAFGLGLIISTAGTNSSWYNFLPAVITAGLGMGMVFAPMTQVAMREIRPQLAGAASGVLNTNQQMGAVIGSAAVGALLQSSLASDLKTEAVNRSIALPAQFRQQFVDGFSHAASTGLQVGQGQTGAATHLPPGVPAQVAQLLSQISHDVFVNAFLEAMKSTLYLPVAVVLLAAVVTVLLRRQAPMPAAARGEAGATADKVAA